jgi:thymidylate synthase
MATLISAKTGRDIYAKVIYAAMQIATPNRDPRGQATRDLGPTILEMRTPMEALPTHCGRDLNGRIAVVEALQLIGGFSDAEMIRWASKNLAKMTLDENGVQHGAYGRRIGSQMWAVCRKLRDDVQTRQAQVTLWDSHLDNIEGKNDYPCTSSIIFSSSTYKTLDMTVFMRSNDIFLGLPYDLFQFAQLQMSLCRIMGMQPGSYHHIANSMHLYERDVPAATDIHRPIEPLDPNDMWQPQGIGVGNDPTTRWEDIQERAFHLAHTPDPENLIQNITASERWFATVMADFHISKKEAVACP